MDMLNIQRRMILNKIQKGFKVGDFQYEFSLIKKEVEEAIEAYQNNTNIGEELADIVLLCAGIAEMKKLNLADEICKKMKINENRQYIRQKWYTC